jgi:hypothetical protein
VTALPDEVGLQIGDAVRTRRHVPGLTLVEVAGRARLSHPFLSSGRARASTTRAGCDIAGAAQSRAEARLVVVQHNP